jgi:hypothetical protein
MVSAEQRHSDPRDPINQLGEIWKGILAARGEGKEGKRAKRRRKKMEKRAAALEEEVVLGCLNREEAGKNEYFSRTLSEQFDQRFIADDKDGSDLIRTNLVDIRCNNGELNQRFNQNGRVDHKEKERQCVVEEIPEEVIRRHRIDVTQIRQMDRFKDYHPGRTSNTLYLKNLSARLTEADLRAMFARFQDLADGSPILYKLLSGQMRGQAFVSFPTVEAASAALELVNGYDFKGKHIIIQYGQKMNSSRIVDTSADIVDTSSRNLDTTADVVDTSNSFIEQMQRS